MFFVSCVSHAFASVHCSLVVTCWERADLLALGGDVYSIFVTFPCGILGQVWYLIVSFPDLCRLSYFYYMIDITQTSGASTPNHVVVKLFVSKMQAICINKFPLYQTSSFGYNTVMLWLLNFFTM